jgi:hypothetical protein
MPDLDDRHRQNENFINLLSKDKLNASVQSSAGITF